MPKSRRSKRAVLTTICLLSLGAAGSCGDLGDFTLGVCGNSVLESGEDCEPGDANSDPAKQGYCAPKGDTDQCRYVCRDGATCPTGEACGVDGVCRTPGAGFVTEGSPLQSTARDMHAGDLDGDGRTDVLLTRDDGSLVASFSSGRQLNEPAPFPADASEGIAIGRLKSDLGDPAVAGGGPARERADLVVGSSAALAALLGDPTRKPIVDAVPSYAFDRARILKAPSRAIAPPAGLSADLVLKPDTQIEGLTLQTNDETFVLFLKSGYTTATIPIPFQFGGAVETLSPSSPLAPFVEGRSSSCDELLLTAVMPDGGAWLVSSCGAPLDTDPVPLPVRITVPSGVTVTGGAMAADLEPGPDADITPHLDLVLPTSNGLYVVLGDGASPLHDVVGGSVEAHPCLAPLCTKLGSTPALALQDLNGDGLVDAVTDTGVLLSDASGFYQGAFPGLVPWSEAVVADINGDGYPDVLAAPTGGRTGVEVLTGSDESYFNPTIVATTQPVSLLTTGDFDGDNVDDLLVREASPTASCASPDEIVAFFGRASGGLEAAQVVGRLAGVNQIVSGKLPRLDRRDSISDFGVGSQCEQEQQQISLFFGSGNRQPDAPLLLQDQLGALAQGAAPVVAPYTPTAIALPSGSLAMGGADAIVSAAVATVYTPVVAPGTMPAPATSALFIQESPAEQIFKRQHVLPLTLAPAAVAKAVVAVGSFDGDPEAEIVVWSPSLEGANLTIVDNWSCLGKTSDDPAHCDTSPATTVVLDPVDPALVAKSQLLVADVDGDGDDDLVLLVVTDSGSTWTLFRNDGASTPSFTATPIGEGNLTATAMTILAPAPASVTGGVVTTAPALVFAGAYAGLSGIFGLSLDAASKTHTPIALVGVDGFSGCDAACANRTSLAAGDVDGDGLDDLVLLDTNSVQVFFREEQTAGDAEKVTK